MRVLARFMLAATDARQFPAPALPEVAFLGRSNVGKSSLINSLLGHKVAKTSSIPGRTRSINFYEVRWAGKPAPEVVFTDLPGYGYAKISREISQTWPEFIEPYLLERPCLALCLVLVDISIAPQPSDRQMVDFLSAAGRPFLVIATKADRLSGNQLHNALQSFGKEYAPGRVVPYSARTGDGQAQLWQEIRQALPARAASSPVPRT
ncbi:MAG: YihA family ribosome biogenesis GTP-binding protein [Acidobacteria bacterium]|jgi:GTP-binding protein|nr:YihA family ribosome biogenesis GTP-binding protein [Acidobacteriota bacterium]